MDSGGYKSREKPNDRDKIASQNMTLARLLPPVSTVDIVIMHSVLSSKNLCITTYNSRGQSARFCRDSAPILFAILCAIQDPEYRDSARFCRIVPESRAFENQLRSWFSGDSAAILDTILAPIEVFEAISTSSNRVNLFLKCSTVSPLNEQAYMWAWVASDL